MPNVARSTPSGRQPVVTLSPGAAALRSLRTAPGAAGLAGLEPATYARDHAAFEALSDQRALIAAHLAARLAVRDTGPVAVLSVGCGDGTLDAPLAAGLADVVPTRPVRYVGVDPFAASTASFGLALQSLRREQLSSEVHVATFADAPVTGGFDVITFVHSMYYVPDVARALERAYAMLRPGGELIVLSGPRGDLNALAEALAPPVDGHPQWFSDDVVAGLERAGLAAERTVTLGAQVDLGGAGDDVLDFTVQARLTPSLRTLVRTYLDAVSLPDAATGRRLVPHPVDVHRVRRRG